MEQQSVVITENESVNITQSTDEQDLQEIKIVIIPFLEETQTINF